MLCTMALILASGAAMASGDCPVTTAELDLHLVRAMAAFEEQRLLDFEQHRRNAEAAMDCLGEILQDQALLNVHLVWTERALLDGDAEALSAGLRALRVLAPGFRLPASWAAAGRAVGEVYSEAAELGAGREVRLPGRLVVDGHLASAYIPAERASVVQIRNADGSWSGWYVLPSDPTTTWLMAREARDPAPPDALAPVPVPAD